MAKKYQPNGKGVMDDACGDVELSDARFLQGGQGRFRNARINLPLSPKTFVDKRKGEQGLSPEEQPDKYDLAL